MKIRKGRMGWFIFTLVVLVGFIGLMIYQLINHDFDPTNPVLAIFVGDSLMSCIEKKKK